MKRNINKIDISTINDNTNLSKLYVDILGITYKISDITNGYKASANKKEHILHLLNISEKYQLLEDTASFCFIDNIKLNNIVFLTRFLIRDGVLYKMQASVFFDAFNIPNIKHPYKNTRLCFIIFTNSFFTKYPLKDGYEEKFYTKLYGADWKRIVRNNRLKELMTIYEQEAKKV